MVVDGEQALQSLIARYLAEDDITVLSAMTNRDAVTQLEEKNDAEVDVILVDRKIPGTSMHGLYLVRPGEKMQDPEETILFKPFTKQQLKDFIHKNVR